MRMKLGMKLGMNNEILMSCVKIFECVKDAYYLQKYKIGCYPVI